MLLKVLLVQYAFESTVACFFLILGTVVVVAISGFKVFFSTSVVVFRGAADRNSYDKMFLPALLNLRISVHQVYSS